MPCVSLFFHGKAARKQALWAKHIVSLGKNQATPAPFLLIHAGM